MARVAIHTFIGVAHRPQTEIVRPADKHTVERDNLERMIPTDPPSAGVLADLPTKTSDRLLRGASTAWIPA
jgi:hypothetical protein